MKLTKLVTLGVISAALFAGAAHAQTTPFYAGAAYVWSLMDPDPKPLLNRGLASQDFDKDPSGWKIFGGYQLNETWGGELAYTDFGTVGVVGRIGTTPVRGAIEQTSISAMAVATVPFTEELTLLFKAGGHFWDVDAEAGTTIAYSKSGIDPAFGTSLLFQFQPRLAFRIDIDKILGSYSALTFAGGFTFKF